MTNTAPHDADTKPDGDTPARTMRQASFAQRLPVITASYNVAGGSSAMPFGIAPTGFTLMMHAAGERAGAAAAGAAWAICCLTHRVQGTA